MSKLDDIRENIRNSRPVRYLIVLSKKIVLPGFEGLPLYNVSSFFVEGLKQGSLETRASSLAFKFFLALIPAIIFLLTLIPYLPIENFHQELLILMYKVLPQKGFELFDSMVKDLITEKRGELLSFGFVFTLYLATNGIEALMQAFNSSYHVDYKWHPLKKKGFAVLLLLILSILIVVAVGLIIFSGFILNYLKSHGIIQNQTSLFLLQVGKWIIILGAYFFSISFLYYLGNVKKSRFKFISAGSTMATILSLVISGGFAYYVNNFANYNKFYGSLGAIIVIMLWIYFNAFALLLGFELNASIKKARQIRGMEITDIEKPDDSEEY